MTSCSPLEDSSTSMVSRRLTDGQIDKEIDRLI